MNSWRNLVVKTDCSIIDVMKVLQNHVQFAVVVDENMKLLGSVTDGDVRRGILNGIPLNDKIELIMNKNPKTVSGKMSKKQMEEFLKKNTVDRISHIPVVNDAGMLIDVFSREEISSSLIKLNPVVIMAGGLGKRLGELTTNCPKPLLEVGGKPILLTILECFMEYGFRDFYFSVNYKSEMIKEYFGNGEKWDISITYIEESKPLGTAGCLGLIDLKSKEPIIVMNGDLLTKVNLSNLLDFHNTNSNAVTMCVKKYHFQVPYGVINTEGDIITSISEKPVFDFFVNAGIYVISPEVMKLVPHDDYFDMTTLVSKVLDNKEKAGVFPLHEYWQDIGQREDFNKAMVEYTEVFNKIRNIR